MTVDYSAPDRWRIQPSRDLTELVIGKDVYMVSKGKSTKLPFGGGAIRKVIEEAGFSVREEVRQTGLHEIQTAGASVYFAAPGGRYGSETRL